MIAAESNDDFIVKCRGTTKDFHQGPITVRALRGVDLEIRGGELTLLVGPSGCGKTTLLSVMAGILEPTSGEIQVLGRNLPKLSMRQKTLFRRQYVGFVFQQFNLLPALTAVENAAVPLVIAGWSKSKAVQRSRELLQELDLADRSEAYPRQLSGGQQRRVAIARALVNDPKMLVCDEPTSALDAKTGHATMELLKVVAVEVGRAVIVVTHDPRVFPFGDRIATMEDGRVTRVENQPEDATGEPGSGL